MEFYKAWFDNPKTVGAIAPTGTMLARKMASTIRPADGSMVLELGPGSGVITKAILAHGVQPRNLVSIEYSERFLPSLRRRYPGVNFVHGDALNLSKIAEEHGIEKFSTVISSLPLLSFPVLWRVRLIDKMLDFLEPGGSLIQFSYGRQPPVPARCKRYTVSHVETVWFNLPPARIWAYQRSVAVPGQPRPGLSRSVEDLTTVG